MKKQKPEVGDVLFGRQTGHNWAAKKIKKYLCVRDTGVPVFRAMPYDEVHDKENRDTWPMGMKFSRETWKQITPHHAGIYKLFPTREEAENGKRKGGD